MPDAAHSESWHVLTIESMCFDCSAGSGSLSKWITLFSLFNLPVHWWNPFTSGANSNSTPPPPHTHTLHPQHSSLKDSHCQSIPPTPSCSTCKVNMYRRHIEKVITGAFLRSVSQSLDMKAKALCLFYSPSMGCLFLYWSSSVSEVLRMNVAICRRERAPRTTNHFNTKLDHRLAQIFLKDKQPQRRRHKFWFCK